MWSSLPRQGWPPSVRAIKSQLKSAITVHARRDYRSELEERVFSIVSACSCLIEHGPQATLRSLRTLSLKTRKAKEQGPTSRGSLRIVIVVVLVLAGIHHPSSLMPSSCFDGQVRTPIGLVSPGATLTNFQQFPNPQWLIGVMGFVAFFPCSRCTFFTL